MSRRARIAALAALALVFAGVAPAARAHAAPRPEHGALQVFAAASLLDAFTELGHMLERQRPGVVVRINFAGSQQLAAQIEQGARADVFASADERWMGYARERGLLAGDATEFARNKLVVIVPRANPAHIGRLQDLARSGVKLVLCADQVPAGRYGRTVLRNLGAGAGFGPDFAPRVLRNLVSEEENVKSIVSKVQLGEADAGIVYRSDVTPRLKRYLRVFELPDASNVLAAYPIAILKDGPQPEAARAFVDLVLSSAGQRVLARHGLTPISAADP